MARIMGIDPGFGGMGVVMVEGRRVLHAAANRTERQAKKRGLRVASDDVVRAQQQARFLQDLIDNWSPAGIVVELPDDGARGARANRGMGLATGIVATILELSRIPVEWVTPADVKQAAAGHQNASKADVGAAMRAYFQWPTDLTTTKADLEHIFDAAGAVRAAEGGILVRALARAADGR